MKLKDRENRTIEELYSDSTNQSAFNENKEHTIDFIEWLKNRFRKLTELTNKQRKEIDTLTKELNEFYADLL